MGVCTFYRLVWSASRGGSSMTSCCWVGHCGRGQCAETLRQPCCGRIQESRCLQCPLRSCCSLPDNKARLRRDYKKTANGLWYCQHGHYGEITGTVNLTMRSPSMSLRLKIKVKIKLKSATLVSIHYAEVVLWDHQPQRQTLWGRAGYLILRLTYVPTHPVSTHYLFVPRRTVFAPDICLIMLRSEKGGVVFGVVF